MSTTALTSNPAPVIVKTLPPSKNKPFEVKIGNQNEIEKLEQKYTAGEISKFEYNVAKEMLKTGSYGLNSIACSTTA